jgi:hypothetical protein
METPIKEPHGTILWIAVEDRDVSIQDRSEKRTPFGPFFLLRGLLYGILKTMNMKDNLNKNEYVFRGRKKYSKPIRPG